MRYGSVCSGIEAATAAWHPLGWQPAFFSEIDAFPRAVLAHHYPHVPLHGDFTTIQEGDYAAIDLLVGGTPCQSFSVAGLRKGLDDDRGNLALEFCRLALRLRPKWVVWENVPGVLSMDGGRSFASILGGLAECGYGLAYRVLDAQFVRVDGFGRAVPQRRRRVFVVGCLGDWRRAAAVLFERASLSGNPAPRRQAGQKPAATLGTSAARRRGLDDRGDAGANLITHAIQAGALRENHESGPDGVGVQEGIAYTLEARAEVQAVCFGGNNQSGPIDVATAQTAQTAHGGTGRIDFESETFVAHALRADGFDASGDGTGRGTPLVPTLAFRTTGNDGCYDTGDVAGALPTATDPNWMTLVQSWRVRRLTPLECERLQGFPDGYTAIRYRHKPAADGPRYKALGNSMAVNCMRWLGLRIQMVEDLGRG